MTSLFDGPSKRTERLIILGFIAWGFLALTLLWFLARPVAEWFSSGG